ncbi:hypothetical protein HRbin12_00026 [bacterium HR12]|nr:hypothetical protein HRbin12_00026 [bacterium HR12]
MYATPNPPPRSSTSASNPVRSRSSTRRSRRTSTAARYGSTSRIWEPMCACSPTGRTPPSSIARATTAGISATGIPNFEPASPVRIARWAPAPTSGRTRRRMSCTTPRSRAIRSRRSSSSGLSTFTSRSPSSTARESSASDLLFPCRTIREGGAPARRHASTSPSVAARRSSPSSRTRRITWWEVKAFTAYSGCGNSRAKVRARSRRWASSATRSGVPKRAASSSAATPATRSPASSRTALVGHGGGAEAAIPDVLRPRRRSARPRAAPSTPARPPRGGGGRSRSPPWRRSRGAGGPGSGLRRP